jgi:hypothetical protein
MAALLGIFRATALLIGLWAVLGLVAYLTTPLPPIEPAWAVDEGSADQSARAAAALPGSDPSRYATAGGGAGSDAEDPASGEASARDDDAPGTQTEPAGAEGDAPDDEGAADAANDEGDGDAAGAAAAAGSDDGYAEGALAAAEDGDDGAAAEPAKARPPTPFAALVRRGGEPTPTTFVCEAEVAAPSAALVDLVGDPRPELAVGCGDRLLLLALRGSPPRPLRVATFDAPATEPGVQASHITRVTVGDVTGDGLPDLVVPVWREGVRGDVRAGGLFVVPREATGGFGGVRELLDVPVVEVRNLIERVGATTYLAALHRASGVARRRSELVVFRGGAAPEKTDTLLTGVGAVAMAAVDLDGDRIRDLAALAGDDPQLDVFGGTGEGRYGRRFTLPVRDGRDLVAMDVDGDRRDDLVVVTAEGYSVVLGPDEDRGRGTATLRSLAGSGAVALPVLTDPVPFDVDGDEREDLVGVVDGRELVALPGGAPFTFAAPRAVVPTGWVPNAGRLSGWVLGDFAIDGRPDLALLFRRDEGTPWELALLSDLRDARSTGPTEQPARLEDAPLTLNVPLAEVARE